MVRASHLPPPTPPAKPCSLVAAILGRRMEKAQQEAPNSVVLAAGHWRLPLGSGRLRAGSAGPGRSPLRVSTSRLWSPDPIPPPGPPEEPSWREVQGMGGEAEGQLWSEDSAGVSEDLCGRTAGQREGWSPAPPQGLRDLPALFILHIWILKRRSFFLPT